MAQKKNIKPNLIFVCFWLDTKFTSIYMPIQWTSLKLKIKENKFSSDSTFFLLLLLVAYFFFLYWFSYADWLHINKLYCRGVICFVFFYVDIESFFVRQNFSRTFRVFMLSIPQSSVNVYNICTQCIIVMKYISMMKIGPYYYRLTYYSGMASDQCCVWFVYGLWNFVFIS